MSRPTDLMRFNALEVAKREYCRLIVEASIQTASREKPPKSPLYRFRPDQPVLVYREKENRCTGSRLLRRIDGKTAYVDLCERTGPRNFNIPQSNPAHLPSMNVLLGHIPIAPANTPAQNARQKSLFRPGLTPPIPIAYFAEVFHPRDPRTELFNESRREENDGLISRGTFCIVLRSEDENLQNIIPSRFMLTIKHDQNGEERYKARFVVGGHE